MEINVPLLTIVMFLKVNGYGFKMNPVEAEDFTVNMVNHKYSQRISLLLLRITPI
jgi:prophage maintenance system killer protein